jgi:hypothetical protein
MDAPMKSLCVSPSPRLRVSPPAKSPIPLLADIRQLIFATRERVALAANASLVMLYWQIGRRIRKDILKEKRAEYGEQIVHALSGQLTLEFGRGFTRTNLFNMVRFAEVFPDPKIVHALSGQLSWTHLRQIFYLEDPLIHVASYLTKALPKAALERKLHEAVRLARARLQASQAGKADAFEIS